MDNLETLKKDVDYWHAEWEKERQRVDFLEQKIEFYKNLPFGNGETLSEWASEWGIAEALEKAAAFGLCKRWEVGETVANLYEQAGFHLENGAGNIYPDPCALVYWAAFDKLAERFPRIESFLGVDAADCYSDFLVDFEKETEINAFLEILKKWAGQSYEKESPLGMALAWEKETYKGILKEVLKALHAPSGFFESLFEVVETETA